MEKNIYIVKNWIQNLIFQAEMGNVITPVLGSVVPLASQHVYHRQGHNPLYGAMHDYANIR